MDRLMGLETLFVSTEKYGAIFSWYFQLFLTGLLGKMESTLYEHFSGSNFVSLEWTCPLTRGVPKERFRGIVTTLSPSPPLPVYSYQNLLFDLKPKQLLW